MPFRIWIRKQLASRVIRHLAGLAYRVRPVWGWRVLCWGKRVRRPWDTWMFEQELPVELRRCR